MWEEGLALYIYSAQHVRLLQVVGMGLILAPHEVFCSVAVIFILTVSYGPLPPNLIASQMWNSGLSYQSPSWILKASVLSYLIALLAVYQPRGNDWLPQ